MLRILLELELINLGLCSRNELYRVRWSRRKLSCCSLADNWWRNDTPAPQKWVPRKLNSSLVSLWLFFIKNDKSKCPRLVTSHFKRSKTFDIKGFEMWRHVWRAFAHVIFGENGQRETGDELGLGGLLFHPRKQVIIIMAFSFFSFEKFELAVVTDLLFSVLTACEWCKQWMNVAKTMILRPWRHTKRKHVHEQGTNLLIQRCLLLIQLFLKTLIEKDTDSLKIDHRSVLNLFCQITVRECSFPAILKCQWFVNF